MSGIGTITAAEVFSERVELQPRTSDPTTTEEGEGWIRSDIAPESNQIATFRVDTGGSTIDVPILQTGTSTGDVVEALRLSVGGTLGYVPAIPESKAAFPALRLQHNGQIYGWHDARGETAFFDVAITSTNAPVDDGETLTVDYSVQNTGGSLDNTQDIRLDVGSTERDRDNDVTVASGGSTTGQLSWGSAAQGSYTASVLSDDDVASTSVSVKSATPDSLVSWYKFNGDASDSEGSNDGTYTGSGFSSDSVEGTQSIRFDGTDEYVEANSFSEINESKPWTVICWFKHDGGSGEQALWGQAPGSNNRQILFLEGDVLTANVYDGSHNKTGTSFSDTTSWHQAAVTYNGSGSPTLYLDATSVSDSTNQRTPGTHSNFYIGDKNAGSAPFDGRVDSFEVYDIELTQSDIQDRYDAYA